jgi:MFS transporter, PPP family, 3-phenylpropionic acid transporter
VIGLQALHGLTFGLFWGAAVKAMSAQVPSRLRATGQAVFSAVVFGAGNAAGYALAGLGYDRYASVAPLYAWAGVLEAIPLALVLVTSPGRSTDGRVPRPGPS